MLGLEIRNYEIWYPPQNLVWIVIFKHWNNVKWVFNCNEFDIINLRYVQEGFHKQQKNTLSMEDRNLFSLVSQWYWAYDVQYPILKSGILWILGYCKFQALLIPYFVILSKAMKQLDKRICWNRNLYVNVPFVVSLGIQKCRVLGKLAHDQHHPKKELSINTPSWKYVVLCTKYKLGILYRCLTIFCWLNKTKKEVLLWELNISNLYFVVLEKYIGFEVIDGLFNNVSWAICS